MPLLDIGKNVTGIELMYDVDIKSRRWLLLYGDTVTGWMFFRGKPQEVSGNVLSINGLDRTFELKDSNGTSVSLYCKKRLNPDCGSIAQNTFLNLANLVENVRAIEIDSRLYLWDGAIIDPSKDRAALYSPAIRNVQLDWNILSLFYRFRRHVSPVAKMGPRTILMAVIDIGYCDKSVIFSIFGCNAVPGIYESGVDQKEFWYQFNGENHSGERGENSPTLKEFFGNGTIAVSPDSYRTKCQLYAAFRYASVIRVYGPGVECRDFEMSGAVFHSSSVEKLRRDMIATYGALLSIDANDFDYAASLLERHESEKNVGDFAWFMSVVRSARGTISPRKERAESRRLSPDLE
jgi:hypothetical protein